MSETQIDGVILTPLNSTKEVVLEGHRQHQCVGRYAHDCAKGHYRVYAVLEPDGTRSTLGLWLGRYGERRKWRIEQHRGKHNERVSEAAVKAGKRLLDLYQKAYRALTF
ncbi:PcfJ domain-containing protein [Verminephrobacter eiseniae]|uniref:PcfJ domain-containing protein n=1 Tax=Verminephrobacter eiseniae TaxID=364317 RepID=UPI0022386AD5|nr:PcfJ domain-containing protein [Verminephrobacter eiseniae]